MEKVIQYPVNIPALDENEVEKYISCLLLEKKLQKEEFSEILEYIRQLKPYDKLIYTSLSEKNLIWLISVEIVYIFQSKYPLFLLSK